VFEFLGAARDRAKEAPPEKAHVEEAAAVPAEEAPSEHMSAEEAGGNPE
jgi:hypothetical protein